MKPTWLRQIAVWLDRYLSNNLCRVAFRMKDFTRRMKNLTTAKWCCRWSLVFWHIQSTAARLEFWKELSHKIKDSWKCLHLDTGGDRRHSRWLHTGSDGRRIWWLHTGSDGRLSWWLHTGSDGRHSWWLHTGSDRRLSWWLHTGSDGRLSWWLHTGSDRRLIWRWKCHYSCALHRRSCWWHLNWWLCPDCMQETRPYLQFML